MTQRIFIPILFVFFISLSQNFYSQTFSLGTDDHIQVFQYSSKKAEGLNLKAYTEKVFKKDSTIDFKNIDTYISTKKCRRKKSKDGRKKCVTDYISNYVNSHFNWKYGEIKGRFEIHIRFKVNRNGDISAILAKGTNQKCELEAIRIIRKLPRFIPATKDGKPVAVNFHMPIIGFIN